MGKSAEVIFSWQNIRKIVGGGSSSLSHILSMLLMISAAITTDRHAKRESGHSMYLSTTPDTKAPTA
ncbi:hypothetical protein LLG46_03655 [bacterium]|nr:hypothetical protein [bacterium]